MDKATKKKVMSLIEELWGPAYQKGMRNNINPIPQGATHMDKHGNYYCAGDTCVWSIWDPLSNQWVSTEMSDGFIQTSMYRVISVPDYQEELNDKYNEGFEKAIQR